MAEGGVQIAVYALEYRLGAPLVGIRQCAAPDLERNAEVRQFACLGEQEAVISRSESNRIITAYSITTR